MTTIELLPTASVRVFLKVPGMEVFMAKNLRTEPPSTGNKLGCDSRPDEKDPLENSLDDWAAGLRGLYARVARTLGVNPSYVKRVARGEQQSEEIEEELSRELERTVRKFGKKRPSARQKTVRNKRIVRKLATKPGGKSQAN